MRGLCSTASFANPCAASQGTAKLAKRDFDWKSQLKLDIKKRAAAADHIDVAKRLAHAEQISAKSKL
jgi:hypothetical protein